MKVRKIVFTVLGAIVIYVIAGTIYYTGKYSATQPIEPVQATQEVYVSKQDELLNLTNAERQKASVAPLIEDEALNRSAQRKAEQMLAENNYSHVDSNNVHGYDYIADETSDCVLIAENITNTNYPLAAIGSWMGSKKGHREAILNIEYDYIGFGIVGNYTVQHFCSID